MTDIPYRKMPTMTANERHIAGQGGAAAPLLIAALVLLALLGAYWGLSAYSSRQAEKKLSDWVYQNHLDNYLVWDSVGSSPLGGKIVIEGLQLRLSDAGQTIEARRATLSDIISNDERLRARIALQDIALPENMQKTLMVADAFAQGFIINSGRRSIEPFALELLVDADDKKRSFVTAVKTDIPQMLALEFGVTLGGMSNVTRTLRDLQREQRTPSEKELLSLLFVIQKLTSIGEKFRNADLIEAHVGVSDNGMVSRSVALSQRYQTQLVIDDGDADTQRKKALQQYAATLETRCRENLDPALKPLENACDILPKIIRGERKGMRFEVAPQSRFRFSDMAALQGNPESGRRTLERLNPTLKPL